MLIIGDTRRPSRSTFWGSGNAKLLPQAAHLLVQSELQDLGGLGVMLQESPSIMKSVFEGMTAEEVAEAAKFFMQVSAACWQRYGELVGAFK